MRAKDVRRWVVCGATALVMGSLTMRAGCGPEERAQTLLRLVNAGYQALSRVESEAQWKAVTDVTPAHSAAAEAAGKAAAAFNGNPALIREARALLARREALSPLTARQLERALLNAAEGPMTNPELTARRVAAETAAAARMNSFTFRLDGKPITPNEIDRILATSSNLEKRRKAWLASKEIGPALKPGLVELRALRNAVAQEMGYHDYFALQAARYDMTAQEILDLQEQFMKDLRPLYLQLHTWAKHELARKFRRPVPNRIPAHWINNRWAQEWTGFVPALNLDDALAKHDAEWVVRTAERYFVSIGLDPLPDSFWRKSDLYPLPAGSPRKKNTHASCWHIDLNHDIRALMNVEPVTSWFFTAHHELGHGHYDLCYARPEVPPLLRTSANPSFHEGMAMLAELAAGQRPYLESLGLLPKSEGDDSLIPYLLNDALANVVPFMFWASGVMTHWEADIYIRNLPPERWNARWWEYKRRFQGIEPPVPRDESACDPASKTHITDAPCYYFAYAMATVLKFQLHDYIARRVLHQPPQACNYAGHPEVGRFLRRIMEKGATEDWRKLLIEATGEPLSTRAMVEYYKPLLKWLERQNRGRKIGWD